MRTSYVFHRYRDGVRMPESVIIHDAETLEEATVKASRLLNGMNVMVGDTFQYAEHAATEEKLAKVEAERDALVANVERLAGPAVDLADTVENQEEVPLHKWALKCARMVRLVRRAAADAPTASLARHDAELLNRPFEGLPGCTDGGCVVKKPEGMHTNGGCQCIKYQTASIIVQRLAHLRDQFRRKAEEGGS